MSNKNPHEITKHEPGAHLREEVGQDPLLTRLAQSGPLRDQDLTGWAESSEGRETFGRLLARKRESAPDLVPNPQRRRFFARPRVWYALTGAAVVVGVLVAAIVLGTPGHLQQVAISPTSTVAASTATTAAASTAKQLPSIASPSTTAGTPYSPDTPATSVAGTPSTGGTSSFAQTGGVPYRRIPARDALAGVVRLARLATGKAIEGPSAPTFSPHELLQEAVTAGVLSTSQAAGLDLDSAVTRRTYVVWMWRAIGPHLPRGIVNAGLSDISNLSAEEQEAVAGLAAAGIVRGDSNRAFNGNDVLTQGAEQKFVGRAEAALRLR